MLDQNGLRKQKIDTLDLRYHLLLLLLPLLLIALLFWVTSPAGELPWLQWGGVSIIYFLAYSWAILSIKGDWADCGNTWSRCWGSTKPPSN